MTATFGSAVMWIALLGQTTNPVAPRIAVVNLAEVSERYQRTVDLEVHFEGRRAKFNQDRDAMRDKLERIAKSLREELKPGTDEYRERAKQAAILETESKWFVETEGQKIEEGLKESLRSIFVDVQGAVRELAEEKGLDIVVAGDQLPEQIPESPTQLRQQILFQKVLYWSPRVDISQEVVARLNERYQAKEKDPQTADPKAKREEKPKPAGKNP